MYHIGFCGDDNYMKFIAVAMYSIIKNTDSSKSYKNLLPYEIVENQDKTEEKYCFHIITDGISEDTKNKLLQLEKTLNAMYPCSLEIHYVNNDVFKGFPKWRGNYAAYFRIFYPDLLPAEVKYFLYLDGDILVVSDIRQIFCENIENYVLGGVPGYRATIKRLQKDVVPALNKNNKPYSFHSHKFYICSGVMTINLKKWHEKNPWEKIKWFLNTYAVRYPDQDALNFVFKNDIKALDFKYDLFFESKAEQHTEEAVSQLRKFGVELEPLKEPCILHYMVKPWDTAGLHFSVSEIVLVEYIPLWWKYAEEVPFFQEELLSILQDDEFKAKMEKLHKRKERYQKWAWLYWLRKHVQMMKGQFSYWLDSFK